MPDRENKIDNGTIGSMPCEISLNNVLIELGNAKVTTTTLRRYEKFRLGLRKLEVLIDPHPEFFQTMMLLWRKENFEAWKQAKVPKIVYTLTQCCMTAQYRITMEKLKERKHRCKV